MECISVLIFALLMSVPLLKLTNPANIKRIDYSEDHELGEDEQHSEHWEGFMDIRCSHPPGSIQVHQGKELLFSVEDNVEEKVWDTELAFDVEHGSAEFVVKVKWPAGVQGYLELFVEPDGQLSRKAGAWGSISQVSILEFEWPHQH